MINEFAIEQDLYKEPLPPIFVTTIDERLLERDHFQSFLSSAVDSDGNVGVSAIYGERCAITSITFSTLSSSLVVRFAKQHGRRALVFLKEWILNNPRYVKVAFKMDILALALFTDLSLQISDAVDLLSLKVTGDRGSLETLMWVMGGEHQLHKFNVKSLFFDNVKGMSSVDVALQAWAACLAATLSDVTSIPRIDTSKWTPKRLAPLAKIARDGDLLESNKPVFIRNDVRPDISVNKDQVNMICERFRTRIRISDSQIVLIETKDRTATAGHAKRVQGRNAQVLVNGPINGEIVSISTIGKGDRTYAEVARREIILQVLQGRTPLLSQPFFQHIWFPHERTVWSKQDGIIFEPHTYFPQRSLNLSQEIAVGKILSSSDDNRVVMIHGPPGTGKTTVIAAAVTSFHHSDPTRSVWITAQSNVAVKNIAEKLCAVGFYDFRLLVSKDFHFDWHEHLYAETLEARLIRSDEFIGDIVGAERQLLDARIILCTLTMLSNNSIRAYVQIAPVNTVIFDEASQIEVGDYIPVIHRFSSTLRKMVFIGDNKQLAPYGQEEIPELQSVFEFNHLLMKATFLDTQYRMPSIIGNFISYSVYDGKLRTCHRSIDRKACRFIDVKGGEENRHGHSWLNRGEAMVISRLAHLYQNQNKHYRIITPYDAQRTVIETALKNVDLPWENRVFNVDSFQGLLSHLSIGYSCLTNTGNEGDHIIVSVVRSGSIGFLQNERRTNVMLTRCKQSMIICTSRAFMSSKQVSRTLVGRLAASLGPDAWIEGRDLLNGYLP
ncbi:P-loop containing nucleoside triphosphate hydrolase protein [Scleroderma citrinum]